MARGGIPDRDCPSDEASMRFWCHLSEKETNRDKVKVKTTAQAQVAPSTMVDALGTAFLPQNVVHVANPAQMIANRVAPAASSSQPSENVSPVPPGPCFFFWIPFCFVIHFLPYRTCCQSEEQTEAFAKRSRQRPSWNGLGPENVGAEEGIAACCPLFLE